MVIVSNDLKILKNEVLYEWSIINKQQGKFIAFLFDIGIELINYYMNAFMMVCKFLIIINSRKNFINNWEKSLITIKWLKI